MPVAGVGTLPSFGWRKTAFLEAHAIALDGSGNVFVGGEFELATDLGGATLVSDFPDGGADAFLASYTTSGEHRWSKGFGGEGADRIVSLGVDADGNVYVTGEFTAGADLGTGAFNSDQRVVASFDNDGEHRWTRPVGLARPRDLAVQPNGTVLVTGEFDETADFGSGAIQSAGSKDAFIASFDSDGHARWAQGWGGISLDSGARLATNGTDVAVTGEFNIRAEVAGTMLESAAGTGAFVASVGASGEPRWAQSVGEGGSYEAGDVAVNRDGLVYAIGMNDISRRSFLVRFDASGGERVELAPDERRSGTGALVTVDARDNVYAAGLFSGSTDLGGGELRAETTGTWLASYDGALRHRWSLAFDIGGPLLPPKAVAVGPEGRIYLLGDFAIPLPTCRPGTFVRAFLVQLREDCP